MKRLKKIANVDIVQFVHKWGTDWTPQNVSNNTIDEIIQMDSDCLYDGEAYRFISFDNFDFIKQYLDKQVELNSNITNISSKDIISLIKEKIKQDTRYCSWSKTPDAAIKFANFVGFTNGVILSTKITGLNLVEFCSKHNDYFNDKYICYYDGDTEYDYYDFQSEINLFTNFQEVISKLPNDYNVKYLWNGQYFELNGNININELLNLL